MSHKPNWDAFAAQQANRARSLQWIDRGVVEGGIFHEPGGIVVEPDATC
jgi:hypothetical protein